jgi:hypothetical protein
MMPIVSHGRRYTWPCSLACVSAVVMSFLVGTARGQDRPPNAPRVSTQPHQGQRPYNPWQDEQFNKWWEESRDNPARNVFDSPNVKGATRAINDAASGMAVAMALGGGIIILLVGLFIMRRLRPPVYARNRALEDPRLRALLAHMAEQGQKADAKAKEERIGEPVADAKSTH